MVTAEAGIEAVRVVELMKVVARLVLKSMTQLPGLNPAPVSVMVAALLAGMLEGDIALRAGATEMPWPVPGELLPSGLLTVSCTNPAIAVTDAGTLTVSCEV